MDGQAMDSGTGDALLVVRDAWLLGPAGRSAPPFTCNTTQPTYGYAGTRRSSAPTRAIGFEASVGRACPWRGRLYRSGLLLMLLLGLVGRRIHSFSNEATRGDEVVSRGRVVAVESSTKLGAREPRTTSASFPLSESRWLYTWEDHREALALDRGTTSRKRRCIRCCTSTGDVDDQVVSSKVLMLQSA